MIAQPLFTGVDQVGLVVHRLQPWLDRYVNLGIGPWWIGTYEPPALTETRVRGVDVHYSMRLALAWVGDTQWELIEPLEGPSIYKEFLKDKGEGFHHIQMSKKNASYASFAERMTKSGCPPVMEGRFGGSKFAYFDTTELLGLMVEVRDAPADYVRPDPDYWYPSCSAPAAFTL